jgi:hypothetical protein
MKRVQFPEDFHAERQPSGRMAYTYQGPRYTLGLDERGRAGYRMLSLLVAAAVVALFVLAGLSHSSGGRVMYVAVPYVLEFFPICMLVGGAIQALCMPGVLTRAGLKSFKDQAAHAMGLFILSAIAGVGQCVYTLTQGVSGFRDWAFVACCALACAASWLLWRVNTRVLAFPEDAGAKEGIGG